MADAGTLSDKQELIVRTAYEAIAASGVDRMSLQAIADQAGVSKGLLIYYFKTKENLVLAAMERVLNRVSARIEDAIAGTGSPRDALVAMIEAIFVGPDANRDFYLVYLDILDHAARFEPFKALHDTFHDIVNAHYAQVIRRGVDAGEFTVADVDASATVLRAIIDGLFLQWLQETDRRRTHRRYRDLCTEAALRYLAA